MSEYSQDLGKAAKRAFSSPTNLAAQRVGRRVSSNTHSASSNKSVTSTRSRRSPSVVTTADEADLFDQMISSTSVAVRNKKQKTGTMSEHFFGGSILSSFSTVDKQPGSPGSPNSNKSNFSAEYSPDTNYFSPGGELAITSPGHVQEEKAYKQTPTLDIPAMDEKKTADDGDEVIAHRKRYATPEPFVATAGGGGGGGGGADVVAKTHIQDTFTVAKQGSNEEVMHLGTLNEAESEDEGENDELSSQKGPFHQSESTCNAVLVETVESRDSGANEGVGDPIEMFRRNGDELAHQEEADPVEAFRRGKTVTPNPELVSQPSENERTVDQERIAVTPNPPEPVTEPSDSEKTGDQERIALVTEGQPTEPFTDEAAQETLTYSFEKGSMIDRQHITPLVEEVPTNEAAFELIHQQHMAPLIEEVLDFEPSVDEAPSELVDQKHAAPAVEEESATEPIFAETASDRVGQQNSALVREGHHPLGCNVDNAAVMRVDRQPIVPVVEEKSTVVDTAFELVDQQNIALVTEENHLLGSSEQEHPLEPNRDKAAIELHQHQIVQVVTEEKYVELPVDETESERLDKKHIDPVMEEEQPPEPNKGEKPPETSADQAASELLARFSYHQGPANHVPTVSLDIEPLPSNEKRQQPALPEDEHLANPKEEESDVRLITKPHDNDTTAMLQHMAPASEGKRPEPFVDKKYEPKPTDRFSFYETASANPYDTAQVIEEQSSELIVDDEEASKSLSEFSHKERPADTRVEEVHGTGTFVEEAVPEQVDRFSFHDGSASQEFIAVQKEIPPPESIVDEAVSKPVARFSFYDKTAAQQPVAPVAEKQSLGPIVGDSKFPSFNEKAMVDEHCTSPVEKAGTETSAGNEAAPKPVVRFSFYEETAAEHSWNPSAIEEAVLTASPLASAECQSPITGLETNEVTDRLAEEDEVLSERKSFKEQASVEYETPSEQQERNETPDQTENQFLVGEVVESVDTLPETPQVDEVAEVVLSVGEPETQLGQLEESTKSDNGPLLVPVDAMVCVGHSEAEAQNQSSRADVVTTFSEMSGTTSAVDSPRQEEMVDRKEMAEKPRSLNIEGEQAPLVKQSVDLLCDPQQTLISADVSAQKVVDESTNPENDHARSDVLPALETPAPSDRGDDDETFDLKGEALEHSSIVDAVTKEQTEISSSVSRKTLEDQEIKPLKLPSSMPLDQDAVCESKEETADDLIDFAGNVASTATPRASEITIIDEQPVDLQDGSVKQKNALDEENQDVQEEAIGIPNALQDLQSTNAAVDHDVSEPLRTDEVNFLSVALQAPEVQMGAPEGGEALGSPLASAVETKGPVSRPPVVAQATRAPPTQDQSNFNRLGLGSQAATVDPCGIASATLENLGSFISHSSDNEIDRDALCSAMSAPDQQVRLSQMVESLSTSLTGVALPNDRDQDQQDSCLPIWDSDGCSPMWDSDTDLRNDDESFQILAHKTISFLQTRLDKERGTITLYLADRDEVKNLYPMGMRSMFLDALRYRLSVSPAKPATALDVLVLKCQEFGLDIEGDKNPVIAAESNWAYPRTFDVIDVVDPKNPVISIKTEQLKEIERLGENKEDKSNSLAVALTDSSISDQGVSSTTVETGDIRLVEGPHVCSAEAPSSPMTSIVDENDEEITVDENPEDKKQSGLNEYSHSFSRQTDSRIDTVERTLLDVPSVQSIGDPEDVEPTPDSPTGIEKRDNWVPDLQDQEDRSDPSSPLQCLSKDEKVELDTSNPFDAFGPMASQLEGLNTEPATAPRSVSSAKRDSPPPEDDNERTLSSDAGSAFAPPTHSSKTDTAITPEALLTKLPGVHPGAPFHGYVAMHGPPSEITHQSLPSSAVSGLDSSVGGTDLKVDVTAMLRLQAEIREATKLAQTAENPETVAFWQSHAKDLQAKIDGVQRNMESTARTVHRQTTAENPAEQPRSLPVDKLGQPAGDYHAMEEGNPYHQYHADSTPSKMQPMEYESRMVDVIAPADLPGGYHFEAEIEGQRFLATVPVGGVQQGETFTCFMRELNSVAIDIPVGYWKDNLCHMCKHGLCHPTLWHGLFCPLVSLGQITHRLQLDFLGRHKFPGTEQKFSNRFIMLFVTFSWVALNVGLIYAGNYKWMRAMDFTAADWTAFALVNICMYGFAVFVAQSTRSSVREKFMIREERCYDLEDVMCASTCLPCTLAQMARHTANYDDYEAVCCSKTGLPDGVKVKHTANMKAEGDYLV